MAQAGGVQLIGRQTLRKAPFTPGPRAPPRHDQPGALPPSVPAPRSGLPDSNPSRPIESDAHHSLWLPARPVT